MKPAAATKKAGTTSPLTLVVYCTAEDDDAGLDALVGEYDEMGTNHGKKYFKRRSTEDAEEDSPVFLYFWDNRDGVEFSGWWFGDKVGGAQVWSRHQKADTLPPRTGWCIPWDGPVQPEFIVEPAKTSKAPKISNTAGTPVKTASSTVVEEVIDDDDEEDEAPAPAATTKSNDERVERASEQISIAEIEANQAIESANAMMQGDVSEDGLRVVEELLQSQMSAMTDAHKALGAETQEARRKSPDSVNGLIKLTPRLKTMQSKLMATLGQAKQLFKKKEQEAEELKKRARSEEVQLEAEQRDAKVLEHALPAAMEAVNEAEDAIDTVLAVASPLSADAEEMNEAILGAIKETEEAATKAKTTLQKARNKVNMNTSAAKKFAPEAQKVALAEYSALQEKLAHAEKQLSPYLRIRKEYEQKLVAKKVTAEVASKLGAAEVQVDKLMGILENADVTEVDLKTSEGSVASAKSGLASAMKFVESRMATAQGVLKEDLAQMLERGKESQKKIETLRVQLKERMEQCQLKNVVLQGAKKVQHAEDLLQQTTVAETPFLKGDESIPVSEASAALTACDDAAKAAETAVNQAEAFLKAKLVEVKRFPEAARKNATDELTNYQVQVELVGEKIAAFKSDTAQRKTNVMLQEVTESIVKAEDCVAKTVEAGKLLSEGTIEDIALDTLKDVTDKTLAAEKEAAMACAEGRKAIMAKQKDNSTPDLPAELSKLNTRLGTAKHDLDKVRKIAIQAEKLYKGLVVLSEKEELMKKVDTEVEKTEILTTPLGDERPSDEHIKEMDSAVTGVQKLLTDVVTALKTTEHLIPGSLKDRLLKLQQRAKATQQKLDEMKAMTKEQRDRVMCDDILLEAKAKLSSIDEAFKLVATAEMPYLKGMEILPGDEAAKAIADSESAIVAVQKSISASKQYLAVKTVELRGCVEAVQTTGLAELATLSKQTEEAVQKLTEFKKDTQERRRIAMHQEALGKVAEAEDAAQKMAAGMEPLSPDKATDMSPDDAAELIEKVRELDTDAQGKLDAARNFLAEKQKEKKVPSDLQEMAKLVSRLNSVQVSLAKARSTVEEREQSFVAKMLLGEAESLVQGVEGELEKTIQTAAPLTEEGGKIFVVASMTKMILEALTEYMNKKSISKEEIFKLICQEVPAEQTSQETENGKKAPEGEHCAGSQFVSFLGKIPELCGRADLAFSEEQRTAILEQVDSDQDGYVRVSDFLEVFRERYICTHGIAITDQFDLENSETVTKLSVDEVVDAIGEPKSHDTLGMMRIEVKLHRDGTTGWATLQGNQGTMYLGPFTAYASFMRSLDKTINTAKSSIEQASGWIASKISELRDCKQGPLATAKTDLAKARPRLGAMQAKLEALKKRIEEGKKEHSKREEFEKRKQQEKKDKKAASVILKGINEKVSNVRAGQQKVEECSAPLASSSDKDLNSVATPLSIRKATEIAVKEVSALAVEAQECIKVQEGKVANAPKGPWFDLRQEMTNLEQEIASMEMKANEIMAKVQSACDAMAKDKMGQVAAALRESIKSQNISVDSLYSELASQDVGLISDAAFCEYLAKLPNLDLPPEHKTMLFAAGGAGGLSRRQFFQMLERFYTCVKEIAITEDFDIKSKSSNTLRKLEVGEVVEAIGDLQNDDALGVTRARVRALLDDTTGWVTVKGNQGTPYLNEATRPCYFATAPVCMQDGFPSAGCNDVCTLAIGEVIEVLSGPKQETVGSVVRARVKACSDGVEGWFTLKNRQGEQCAQQGKSLYTCTTNVALTSNVHIKNCDVLRKLSKGEVLLMLEGPVEDETTGAQGVTRIRAQAVKDNAEGWVTTKGNAGTQYATENGCQYVISRSIPLESEFQSDSGKAIRMLSEQETVQLLEGPREEKAEATVRLQGRVVSSGKVGWVTLQKKNLKKWTPQYRCVNATVIHDVLEVGKGQSLRKLDSGEAVELLDGPKEDTEAGVLRIRGRAAKDGAVGWVTIVGNNGKIFLQCMAEK